MSPLDLIVFQTHTYSFLRLMVFYFELVGLSMNLGNSVDLGRLTFSKIFVRPPAWLLYSFLPRIFLKWVGLGKEYRKHNQGMNIVKLWTRWMRRTSWLKIGLEGGESLLTL